jgi:hypothetical protein
MPKSDDSLRPMRGFLTQVACGINWQNREIAAVGKDSGRWHARGGIAARGK